MRDKREYLNPVAYAEMKRRGWTDGEIAQEIGIDRRKVSEFRGQNGYVYKGKYFFEVENFVKNKSN